MNRVIILDNCCFNNNLMPLILKDIKGRKVRILLSRGGNLEKEFKSVGKEKEQNRYKEQKRYREYAKNGFFCYDICSLSVNKKEKQLKKVEHSLRKAGLLISNDLHIIAMAIVSGVDVLVTADGDLADDFGRCYQIDNESGCKYTKKSIKRHVIFRNEKLGKYTTPIKSVRRFLEKAEIKYQSCACIRNDDGCSPF